MVEFSRPLDGGRVLIEDKPPKPGQHIMPRAKEMRTGEIVLPAGCTLGPVALGLLATVGRTSARLIPGPRVAVISTGDELVEAGTKPEGACIRNSNGPMLAAMVARAGACPEYLGIARDERAALKSSIEKGLQSDAIILSGGVSAGTLDLVPAVLQEAGVAAEFHRVAMKPGKPIFFGTSAGGTAVFGLPGNPVSSLVCFELFVKPALQRLAGHTSIEVRAVRARLAVEFRHRSDRPTYHPAVLEEAADARTIRPVAWLGSADLKALAHANALMLFPPGEGTFSVGDSFDVFPLNA
jgi:molybdopterin molybdotransferase